MAEDTTNTESVDEQVDIGSGLSEQTSCLAAIIYVGIGTIILGVIAFELFA